MELAKLSFGKRAELDCWQGKSGSKQLARQILLLMERKKTNLALSADVLTSQELLDLADEVGPHICVLKTHIDILTDFTPDLPEKLVQLARKHDFFIFEDRKFADIGNTVYNQYANGVYRISQWSHITNAHPIPGPGIIDGLQKAAREVEMSKQSILGGPRGLLLLAEMSSAGSLATGGYTTATVKMACDHTDFVIGFVGGRRFDHGSETLDFLYFTPGVQLESGVDSLGQQYRTPEIVVGECLCDVIIVGRGICQASDRLLAAVEYKNRCWTAYENRISKR